MCFYNGFYDWNFNENKQTGQSCQELDWTSQLCQNFHYFFIIQNDKDDQNYWLTWLFEMTKMTKTTNWRENIYIVLNIIFLKKFQTELWTIYEYIVEK
jgi:hypothetical protein